MSEGCALKKESNKTKARCSRDNKNMLMYIVKLYIYTPMHNAKFLGSKISEDKSYCILHLSCSFGK